MRRFAPLAAVVLALAGCGGAGGVDPAAFMPRDTVRFFTAEADSDWKPLARRVLGNDDVGLARRADAFAVGVRANGTTVAVYRTGGEWRGTRPKDSLAGERWYRTARADVPGDALAFGLLLGNRVKRLVRAVPGQVTYLVGTRARVRVIAHPRQEATIALVQFAHGALWLTNDGEGMRARVDGLPRADSYRVRSVESFVNPYAPALFDEIPADVVAFADFPLPVGTFRLQSRLPRRLTALFPASGFVLGAQLDALTGGETAVYWRRGGEVTFVTSPADLGAAEQALGELSPQLPFRVYRAVLGGQLVVSTARAGIRAFLGDTPKLSSRDLGFPEAVTAALWVGPAAPKWLGRPRTAWLARLGVDPTLTVRYGS